jgi:hypothetical protein
MDLDAGIESYQAIEHPAQKPLAWVLVGKRLELHPSGQKAQFTPIVVECSMLSKPGHELELSSIDSDIVDSGCRGLLM